MENMRKIINIQAGKPVLVEPENNIKTLEKGIIWFLRTKKCRRSQKCQEPPKYLLNYPFSVHPKQILQMINNSP